MRPALLVVFILVAVQSGCGFEVGKKPTDGEAPVEIATPVESSPVREAEPAVAAPTPEQTIAPGEADLEEQDRDSDQDPVEVIRRRIAWKKTHAPDGRPPTATPLPVFDRNVRLDGIASSSDLGLMWSRTAAGGFNAEDARTHCQVSDLGGFIDWRAPSVDELHALLIAEMDNAWGDEVRLLWTSTPHDPRGFETIDLPGMTRSHREVGVAHVVCVRDVAPGGGS